MNKCGCLKVWFYILILLLVTTAISCVSHTENNQVMESFQGSDVSRVKFISRDDGDQKSKNKIYFDTKTKQYYTNREAKFLIRSMETKKALERIEVSIDIAPFEPYEDVISFGEEGLHILRFRSVDPVLNWSPIQTFKIYMDLTAPTVKPYWEGKKKIVDGKLFIQPSSLLRISTQDNLSGVSEIVYKRLKEAKERSFPGQLSFKKEGKNEFYISVVDQVGNESDWAYQEFYVDTKPPVNSYEIQGNSFEKDNKIYLSYDHRVIFKSEDDGVGVKKIEYQLKDEPMSLYRHPLIIYYQKVKIRFRGWDHLDNRGKWITKTFIQDFEPPKISFKYIGKNVKARGLIYALSDFKVNVKVKDGISGVGKVLYLYNEQKMENNDPLKPVVFKRAGENMFMVRATDAVGNMEESENLKIFIDTVPPTTTIHSQKLLVLHKGVYLSALPNSVSLTGRDEGGVGVAYTEYSYDGKNFKRYEGPISLETWKKRKREFYYRSVDLLGNVGKAENMIIQIQTKSPKVDIFIEKDDLPDVPLSDIVKRKKLSKKVSKKRLLKTGKSKKSKKSKESKRTEKSVVSETGEKSKVTGPKLISDKKIKKKSKKITTKKIKKKLKKVTAKKTKKKPKKKSKKLTVKKVKKK